MGANYEIIINETDDGESLYLTRDGMLQHQIHTSYDCPEDNTISRLGLAEIITDLVKQILPHRIVFYEKHWDGEVRFDEYTLDCYVLSDTPERKSL